MTLQENLDRIKDLAGTKSGELAMAIRLPAANRLLAARKNAIVREGKASDGTNIGRYSQKPGYYGKGVFVKKGAFRARGKNGGTKFRNGKPHKTMFLPEGYYQFRGIQGRENAFVNLELSGSMLLDYQQQAKGTDILQGFTNEKESLKRLGHEDHYNKPIFRSSKNELEVYNKECAIGFIEVTKKILSGE